MRYISFYRPAGGMVRSPEPAKMAEMTALGERETKAGRLLMMGALLPATLGRRIRLADGKVSVEDGADVAAFAEGAGFAILQAVDETDQRAQVEEFLKIAGDGECILVPLLATPSDE